MSCNNVALLVSLASNSKATKKKTAGCDDTASMIKGGGYEGACIRQPPHRANM